MHMVTEFFIGLAACAIAFASWYAVQAFRTVTKWLNVMLADEEWERNEVCE